jgi:hypothetical protein
MALTIADHKLGAQSNPPGAVVANSACAIGDALCVKVQAGTAVALTPTISDTVNTGNWTAVGTPIADATNSNWEQWFWIRANAAGTPTISVSNLAKTGTLDYVRISGFTGTATLDTGATIQGNFTGTATTAVSASPLTTNFNNEVCLAANTSGAGFTVQPTGNWTSQTASHLYTNIEAASGTSINFTATLSASSWYDLATMGVYDAVAATPTVSTVNGGAAFAEGATGIAVVGTNFASGMTSNLIQGAVSVAQTTTFNSATSASFVATIGTGTQLAYTDASFATTYTVTDTGGTSAAVAVTLTPPGGNIFKTLTSIGSSGTRFTATGTGDLVVGDQLEGSGNSSGTAPIPTGLVFNSDGTFQFSAGNTPANFYVRAYDATNHVWGAWALQTATIPVTSTGWRNIKVFELSSVTGLIRWVHYIPVQFPASVPTNEYDRVDPNGAVTCTVLSSTAGLVQWVDYVPVFLTSDPASGKWRFDANGWIPLVRLN